MFLILVLWAALALATTPDQLERALDEVESYRSSRLADGAPRPPLSEARRTAEGAIVTGMEDVPGSSTKKAWGAALLDVPIGPVWSALNDETRQSRYTAVAYSELIAGEPCKPGRRVLQFVEVPWVTDRWWIGVPKANHELMRASGGSVRELAFESSVDASEIVSESGRQIIDQGMPIGFSRGAWFLVAVDARHTYVEYYLWSDPGGRVPAGLASTFASKGVRENIEAIRKFAKEGNPSCPIH